MPSRVSLISLPEIRFRSQLHWWIPLPRSFSLSDVSQSSPMPAVSVCSIGLLEVRRVVLPRMRFLMTRQSRTFFR